MAPGDDMNPKRLFVGNLTYSVDEKQLWGLFSRYGEVVSVRIIEGKGYGFVEMESYEDARAARNALNETEFQGRNLLIDDVRPPKAKTGFQKGPGGAFPGKKPYPGGGPRSTGRGFKERGRVASQGERRSSARGPGGSDYPERVLKNATRSTDRGQGNEGRRGKPSPAVKKEAGTLERSTKTSPSKKASVFPDKKSRQAPVSDDTPRSSPKHKPRFWPGGRQK